LGPRESRSEAAAATGAEASGRKRSVREVGGGGSVVDAAVVTASVKLLSPPSKPPPAEDVETLDEESERVAGWKQRGRIRLRLNEEEKESE